MRTWGSAIGILLFTAGILYTSFLYARRWMLKREEEKEHVLLRKAYDELDQRVAERTAELEEQRAVSMRSDRLRSLGEMAAGIAHELNQPLVGVRGLAEHLLIGMGRGWDFSDEEVLDNLKEIVDQADRMTHIVQHVRMFAREADSAEVGSVQVNEVVESAVRMLGEQFRSRGLELVCELGEDLPCIVGNPFSLEEVVLNLLVNARDAVEDRVGEDREASPRVVVRTGVAGEGSEQQVRVEVADRGVGIPDSILEKVFDPFFTTKGPDRGTGLGLSICRSIVEEYGGKIEIESRVGQGTTVIVSLPVEEAEEKDEC